LHVLTNKYKFWKLGVDLPNNSVSSFNSLTSRKRQLW